MRGSWQPRPKQSFRENARVLIPIMYDQFMTEAAFVLQHPRLKERLHRMRVSGKPLRYAMEVFETSFGREFRACLEEVKGVLDQMGTIHDCDINIPLLRSFLAEIQVFNRRTDEKISTRGIRTLLRSERVKREGEFGTFCGTMKRWELQKFRLRLIRAMQRIGSPP